jgi:single-strand DNA-binding protein
VANGVSEITLVGYLGADPQQQFSGDGNTKFTRMNLAVNTRQQGEDKANWFNITVFGKLGDVCTQYLRKGSKALFIGSFFQREYDRPDGTRGTSLDVVAHSMTMLDTRPTDGEATYKSNGHSVTPTKAELPMADVAPIPFD